MNPDANPIATPSGRIEIFSAKIASYRYEDCPGHPTWLEPAEWLGSDAAREFPLHLLTTQPSTRLHGQMDMGRVSQQSKVAGREPMRMNRDDASARGIRDGDVVRVFNDRGAILAGAVLTDDIRRGVIQISTGAWYDPLEPGVIGSLDKHGNPNVLTLDKGTSRLAQDHAGPGREVCRRTPASQRLQSAARLKSAIVSYSILRARSRDRSTRIDYLNPEFSHGTYAQKL